MTDNDYVIHIYGLNNGDVKMTFSFNPVYYETGNTELEELIGIAKELQKTLKKLREVNFSVKQE